MEQLVGLFADIAGSKSRDDIHSPTHQQGSHTRDRRDSRENRDSRDSTDFRRAREPSRNARDPSRSARRDASRSTRNTAREARESREFRDPRDPFRDPKEPKDTKDAKYKRESRYLDETELGPPPYQEVADATVQPAIGLGEHELPPTHPSGISPTEKCVNEFISEPVDWVMHPSAPHFVICGRCYVDRIYPTQQWRREFVKYRPSTGMMLRCHFGAIPHMEKRWSKVHTPEDFLSFLKVMQRKKVAKHCPGDTFPRAGINWYTVSSIPGMKICQECRQRLFGGTVFAKYLSASDIQTASICHGSFNYTSRMVDQLLRDDNWEQFVEGMRIRIRLPCCPDQREPHNDDNIGWWYKYTKSGVSKNLFICEACFFDHAYKTDKESSFSITDGLVTRPLCMASLRGNQIADTADVEFSRAEIMRLLHGTDRRCYSQGTVGLKWYTTPTNIQGYGVCHGCYVSKIKPIGGDAYFTPKKDVGKRSSFSCWMNSYHPFYKRHQQVLNETIILGDKHRLENMIRKLSRLNGCQQGGMGQGKNKRWWGWRCLPICVACMKGGNLLDSPAAKRFELHGEKDPYHRVCAMYSMQLRDHFHHSDVATLLDFARRRQELMG